MAKGERSHLFYIGDKQPFKNFELKLDVMTSGSSNGGIYIRYLPEGVEAGSEDLFLTVGTYDLLEGYDALTSASKSKADVVVSESGAAIATFKAAPLSTYFAFPDGTFQVEVFSPKKREARDLTESGAIGLITQP